MRAIKLCNMRNVILRSALALCTCLFLGAATAGMGQTRQENLTKCQSVDADAKITGCTELLKAGQDPTHESGRHLR